MPVNTAFISSLTGIGGGETILLNLIRAAENKKHCLLVTANEGKLIQRAHYFGIDTEVLPELDIRGKAGILRSIPGVTELLRQRKIKAVVLNNFELIWAVAVPARMLGIPVYWICHGQWYSFSGTKARLISALVRKIFAISDNVYNNLKKNNFSPQKLERLTPGVFEETPVKRDFRASLGISPDTKLAGMVARFQHIKGQDVLLQAVPLVSDKRIKFVLVGDSEFGRPEDLAYRERVGQEIKRLGLEDRVILTGYREDTAEVFRALDLLIVPSRNESLGMVIIEAMMAGCPVLASSCDGPLELIRDGENGYLFNVEDAVELAQKITTILNGEQDAVKKQALAYAREKHNALASARKLFEVLEGE